MNINLSRAKDDKGNLCFVMIDDNEEVFVDVEDYKEAKQLGIHYTRIKHHAKKGRRHLKNYIRKYEQRQGVDRLTADDRERKKRRRDKLDAKKRKEQERLQMIEDAKCRDPYWFDNTWNQMFKGWIQHYKTN